VVQNLSADQVKTLQATLESDLLQELEAMVKPPVVNNTVVTNTVVNDLSEEKSQALLAQALMAAEERIQAIQLPEPKVERISVTNTIVQELSDEQRIAWLTEAKTQAAALLATLELPEPTHTVQHTSVTNIIERALSDQQKQQIFEQLFNQAAARLDGMVKPPVVTENYITNIIRETLSNADRESLLTQATQRSLAAMPKPKPQEIPLPGVNNIRSTPTASIGGGQENVAAGAFSIAPGGRDNLAKGAYSLASGRRAKALHDGALVWADSQDQDFVSTTANQASLRASGGVRIQSGTAATGTELAAGGTAWERVSPASSKRDLARADVTDVLDRLNKLAIYTYRNKEEPSGAIHLGPQSEEFYRAFGLGSGPDRINSADIDAVSLAAIQALHQMWLEKLVEAERSKLEIQRLRNEVDGINAFIKELRQLLEVQAAQP